MDLWVTERHDGTTGMTVKVKNTLYHEESEFQTIDILDTEAYGRMLLLDGMVMVTEKDEFIYHELISHVSLLSHPNPRKVLVIGGGDGGTVREVLKHPSVEKVILCEIDGMVIQACRTYLPSMAGKLSDPRVEIEVRDGVAFVANRSNEFDVILIDSTDPLGPGEGLFTEDFYKNVSAALKPDGIMVAQSESPLADQREMRMMYSLLRKVFPVVEPYLGPIPTYPGGYWSWAFCTKDAKPLEYINEAEAARLEKTTRYYNRAIHEAAFAIPNFVKPLVAPVPVESGVS
jgi:spermidine synthase